MAKCSRIISAIILTNILVTSCAIPKANPTTKGAEAIKIPDRREFPVNEEYDPCENFYNYACSKVRSDFQLSENRMSHNIAYDDAEERLLEFQKRYFDNLQLGKPKSNREQVLRTFFNACMNEPARVAEEQQLVRETKKVLADLDTREKLLNYLGSRNASFDQKFLAFGITPNLENPARNDVYFVSNFRYLQDKSYSENSQLMTDMGAAAETMFRGIEYENPKQGSNAVVKFERDQVKVYPSPTEWRDLFQNPTNTSKQSLEKLYPALRFNSIFRRIPDHTTIRDFIPKTMEFLQTVLTTYSIEDIKALVLYYSLASYLDDAYPDVYASFLNYSVKHFGTAPTRPDRRERCTKRMMRNFDREIGSILLPKYFPHDNKASTTKLVHELKAIARNQLENNTWLSPKAKKSAIKKVRAMTFQLWAPTTDREWYFNPPAVYASDTPIRNGKRLYEAILDQDLRELARDRDRKRWLSNPFAVNAFYDFAYNRFTLPAGIVQYPLYDSAGSRESNFGGIGSIIAHEIGHAFDDQGSKRDASGRVKPWMTERDLEVFHQRVAPLIEQFNEAGLNGTLTLGENLADLVGLTISYKAAFPDEKYSYTQEQKQRFFLQFARLWCEVERPGYSDIRRKTDPHALGEARVNEQVKQQIAFKKAFSCPDNSKMVLPLEKIVRIW